MGYKIKEQEMRDLLDGFGFHETKIEGTAELVYDWIHPKKKEQKLGIRLYTSIYRGAARDVGEDAIRAIYFDFSEWMPFGVQPSKVLRIRTWETNLSKRLRTMAGTIARIDEIGCPKCGAVMRKSKSQYGEFFGCSTYHDTNCDGRRTFENVHEWFGEKQADIHYELREREKAE